MKNQVALLEKLCVGLGFNPENVKYIADKALSLVAFQRHVQAQMKIERAIAEKNKKNFYRKYGYRVDHPSWPIVDY